MLSDLQATEKHLAKAKTPEDVFGPLSGLVGTAGLSALVSQYRQIVMTVHPDKFSGTPHEKLAGALFVKLTSWKEQAEVKLAAGTYGNGKVAPAVHAEPAKPSFPQTVRTAKREYVLSGVLAQGDLADLYRCTYSEKGVDVPNVSAVFKIAQSPKDNDLLENEARVLAALYPLAQKAESFYRHLPKVLDSFSFRSGRSVRRVNILSPVEGHVSLARVRATYPDGLDFRDVVWMFKRVLSALGFVHKNHVVHGAILPTHVLVDPFGHGAKIVDWCYAVSGWEGRAGRVKAFSVPFREFYAPEILAKWSPSPQTDVFMAAKCVVYLLGGNVVTNAMPASVPAQFRSFLQSCLIPVQSRRPDDAWALHAELDDLLLRLVGQPKYRRLPELEDFVVNESERLPSR